MRVDGFFSQELHGLKAIVMYLHSLPTNKKNVPELIKDPIALVKDVRTVVEQHRHDNPELAVTGKSVLRMGMDDVDLDVSWFFIFFLVMGPDMKHIRFNLFFRSAG